MKKILALAILLGLTAGAGAQTFPLNNIPIGKGPGKQGWTAVAPGSNGQCLVITGGVPAFGSCGSLSPGGSSGNIQFNNAGAFGGLTDTQVTARINQFTSVLPGATPASGGGTTNFLRADGTFAAPPGGGNVNGSGTPTVGDLAAYTSTSGTAIAGTGYNASQVPGLIPTTSTVTISNGANASVTWAAHGLLGGTPVFFCTTGGLPTGLTACSPVTVGTASANTYLSNPTLYYVCFGGTLATNNFAVATTLANAKAGVCVTTSSAGSGTHTAFANAMACKGCVGELVWNTITIGNSVAAVSGSAGQVWNTISLDAGIWEVWGNTGVIKQGAGTPVFSHMHAGIVYGFSTIPTTPYNSSVAAHITSNDPNGWMFANRPEQIFLTGTTTINATATTDFAPTTANTAGFYGTTWGRRIK